MDVNGFVGVDNDVDIREVDLMGIVSWRSEGNVDRVVAMLVRIFREIVVVV